MGKEQTLVKLRDADPCLKCLIRNELSFKETALQEVINNELYLLEIKEMQNHYPNLATSTIRYCLIFLDTYIPTFF